MILRLLHNLTHRRTTAIHSTVGELFLCSSRLTRRVDIEVMPAGLGSLLLEWATPDDLRALAGAESPLQLSAIARDLGGHL